MNPAALQRLQGSAGNRAVSRMLSAKKPAAARTSKPAQAGPAPAAPAPAVAAAPASAESVQTSAEAPSVQRLAPGTTAAPAHRAGPQADPKFGALKADIKGKQQTMAKHAPPKAEADAAQAAAKPPQDDKEAQGKTANAEKMNAAKPGEFNKAAFIKAVNDAIAAQAPKNLNEAQDFGSSGKAEAVKGQVQGKVSDGKKASAGQIESTTKAAPDTSKAVEKPVTALKPDQPPATPGAPNPANAVPDKAPASATDFSAGPAHVNDEMAQANVTEEQLAKSNEPEFKGALDAKKEGEQHSATAPGVVRAAEDKTLASAKAGAAQTGATAMTALSNDRKVAGTKVASDKEGAKSKDELQRAQVTAKLQKVFDATKTEVEGILSNLDKQVDEKFTRDEKAARDKFTAEHQRKMDDYKDKRYSGISGKLRWVKDKFAGLPDEANQIFVQARQGYVTSMQGVISGVADLIGGELNKAKARIATGRAELQAEVTKLPKDLQSIGKEAAGGFSAKFDELTESVDSKGNELVNTLASKYSEALKSVDEEIDTEKEKNKGLIAQAIGAVKGVIDTILKLKDMLLGVLAKAASAVMAIIKDPIGFLGNLVSAVGAGLKNFMSNIGEHLKKGLIGWLMGSMAEAGIALPEKFDLRGIVKMIASMLGLTWDAIKARIITRGVPPMAMEAVEKSVPVAQKLQSEGIGGIWEEIKEKVGDLKENLFSKISEYLIPTVLMAGITWIISLLNPASAFIKACKMIIDIVTFIVERGAQIIEFVNSVLDAVIAIAGGGAGGVPALIEKALAKSVPVLIGALASILGVGGIANKVKSFFQSLSKPVMKAVDFVVDKIVGFGKKIWSKMKATGKSIGGKIKDKFTKKKDTQAPSKAGPASPDRERVAINEADRLLSTAPNHKGVADRLPGISDRHGVPLRLVTEAVTPTTERVHVQTMATPPHTLPAYDPTTLPEATLWDHADRDFKLADETSEARSRRAAAARSELASRIGGQANAVLIGHMSGKKARDTRGASGEDSAGNSAGHINARHVLGQHRMDFPHPALGTTVNHDWLAYRAVANVPVCGGMAGAFADAGSAKSTIQAAATELMNDWPAFRTQLLRTGRVQQIMSTSGAGICFVRNENAPAPGLLPTWVGGTTNRKLHAGDTHAADDPPLAGHSAPGGTELRILLSANAPNGWFVHSAWPTI